MNGIEHYRQSERLLALADSDVSANFPINTGESKSDILTAALAHAVLAQTAATVREGSVSASDWYSLLTGSEQ